MSADRQRFTANGRPSTPFTGRFAYLLPGRGAVQDGPCQVSFDRESLTLVPGGTPLAFDLGDIDVFEAGEYELRVLLGTGQTLLLTHFGKSFQDLARQLLEAYRNRLVKCLLVSDLGEVARYTGRVHLQGARGCDGPAEIRLYESNLAVLPDAAPGFQWRLADIDQVEFDEREYRVVVSREGERLAIGRLAKRTGELAECLRERASLLRERSARVLHALFPFLAPEEFRQVAALMKEGACASIDDLRRIHRLIEPCLLERVVDASLQPYLRALVERGGGGGWHAGFKVVRKDKENGGEERPAEEWETTGDEGEVVDEGVQRGAPAAVIDLGDGLEVIYWFFFPLAPAGGGARRVAWEATSHGGRATYVFGLDEVGGPRAVHALNRGLVALNFRREPVYLPADTLESDVRFRHYAIAARKVPELALVRRAFAGRAMHRSLPVWEKQIEQFAV